MTDKDLLAIIDRAVDEFNGDLDELESAIPGRTHRRSRLDGRMVGARRAPGHAPCGMALVCSVASSRVYLGVHYPPDVLGAVLAEAAWLLLCLAHQRALPACLPASGVQPAPNPV
jgi:hypothetical protein